MKFKITKDDQDVFHLKMKKGFFRKWVVPSHSEIENAQSINPHNLKLTAYVHSKCLRYVKAAADILKRYYDANQNGSWGRAY